MNGEIMKLLLSYTACIVALGIGSNASTALAQTTGPGPYYATPSWDQTLPSNTRFIVLSNFNSEAVLDRETGLVWERSPSQTTRDWFDSIEHCTLRNTGGRTGWRLPAVAELFSLVDRSQSSPALPAGHPFLGVLFTTGTPATGDFAARLYYSATTLAKNLNARAVDFRLGSLGDISKTTSSVPFALFTWCVRGGAGVDIL
jgi:Protein of unknown function (DUF1566)